MAPGSEPPVGGVPTPTPSDGPLPVGPAEPGEPVETGGLAGAAKAGGSGGAVGGGLRTGGSADGGDAAAFLGRVTALDRGALVRLRGGGGRVTAYARLPFGVLVSRTVAGSVRPSDVTVSAADLFVALELPQAHGDELPLPPRRDVEWRAALPPLSGWQRLDDVPGDVIRSLVQAGAETLRAVPASAAASEGETLLDHEALTVSAASRTVAVPLRVLTALAKMGFLGAGAGGRSGGSEAAGPGGGSGAAGPGGGSEAGGRAGGSGADVVVVSAAGRWVRLAAAYGSAFHHQQTGLGLSPR